MNDKNDPIKRLFEDLKSEVSLIDPVSWCENYLRIDGSPLKLSGGGWKAIADIYRYIGTKAIDRDGKPVIIVKGRQVGASTMSTALELYFTSSGLYGFGPNRPPFRILHCFPALTFVEKFSKDRLSTMIRTSRDNYVIKKSLSFDEEKNKQRNDVPSDTLTHKQFKGENKLWVDSCGQNGIRLQSMTLDAIFFDESQHNNAGDIGNSRKTLTAAKYGRIGEGVQIYFGTPLNKGSFFWKSWEASDQRYFHLGCEYCKEFFPLYTPNSDEWETIWVEKNTVECPKCKTKQDRCEAIERGKWIATKKLLDNGLEPQYVGFHLNQLFIPYFTKEVIIKEKPGIHPTNTERTWKNEVLGEFYSGSAMPITEEEILEKCKNPHRSISTGIFKNSQITTFVGIDWGGKNDDDESDNGGQSYTALVIISVDAAGNIQIENGFKLKNNDFEYKNAVVEDIFKRFSIQLGVADLGFGNDIVPTLQKKLGNKFLGCMNSGSLTNPVRWDEEDLRLLCNKDIILEEIFNLMRKGKILFPLKDSDSYEKMHWLIQHCCSMEKDTKTVQGNIIHKYVKGNSPNDGLMALMYAYLAYKFYKTKGFKIKEHQQGKIVSNAPILAYLPKI